MKKTTSFCPQCGNSFTFFPSAYHGKTKIHCSRKCASDAAWLNLECPNCAKAFRCRRSDPITCCSKSCARQIINRGKQTTFHCDNCGSKVTRKNSNYSQAAYHHFCSHPCWTEWAARYRKSVDDPRPGVAARRKRVNRTCKQCGNQFQITPAQLRYKGYGSFCGRKCWATWLRTHHILPKPPVMRGSCNPNWKGGHGKYRGPNWRKQRLLARERDNYTCQRCGIAEIDLPRELDVHHIRPFREFGLAHYKEANHLDNLISLCDPCHKAVEPRGCITPGIQKAPVEY